MPAMMVASSAGSGGASGSGRANSGMAPASAAILIPKTAKVSIPMSIISKPETPTPKRAAPSIVNTSRPATVNTIVMASLSRNTRSSSIFVTTTSPLSEKTPGTVKTGSPVKSSTSSAVSKARFSGPRGVGISTSNATPSLFAAMSKPPVTCRPGSPASPASPVALSA